MVGEEKQPSPILDFLKKTKTQIADLSIKAANATKTSINTTSEAIQGKVLESKERSKKKKEAKIESLKNDIKEDGYIDSLATPISDYLHELHGGAYEDVSILHVMQMRSGVDYEERYDFANPGIAASNHISALVKNNARFTDVARTLDRIHEPGEFFQYKTIDTAVLGWLLERATDTSVAAYTERCLWEPLGAEADGFYIMDGEPGTGREFSGAGFNATLRDFARIGQMVLNGGVANGNRIVSEDWINLSTQPSGGEDQIRGGYGYQWWTIGGSEAFSAIGLQGQYIYIDPDTNTVVVKLSYFPPGDNRAQDGETMAFMAAASRWQP